MARKCAATKAGVADDSYDVVLVSLDTRTHSVTVLLQSVFQGSIYLILLPSN